MQTRAHPLREPLAVAAAGAALLVAVRVSRPQDAGLPACPSLTLFGLYCPFCGGTRGVYALTTADLGGMVGYNALLPLLLVLGLWGWVAWAAHRMGWSAVPGIPRPRLVLGLTAAVALVYGVVRNFPWEPFTALAP